MRFHFLCPFEIFILLKKFFLSFNHNWLRSIFLMSLLYHLSFLFLCLASFTFSWLDVMSVVYMRVNVCVQLIFPFIHLFIFALLTAILLDLLSFAHSDLLHSQLIFNSYYYEFIPLTQNVYPPFTGMGRGCCITIRPPIIRCFSSCHSITPQYSCSISINIYL